MQTPPASTPQVLDPSLAEKALRQDVKNIVKKAAKGKPLNARERALIAAQTPAGAAEPTVWAQNIAELSRILGVSRQTIYDWKSKGDTPEPATDGRIDVLAWQKYIAERGLAGKGTEAQTTEPLAGAEELKRRKLAIEIEEREFRLACRRREFVALAVVREEWGRHIAQAASLLKKKFEDELPPITSAMSAAEVRIENGKAVEAFIQHMHELNLS